MSSNGAERNLRMKIVSRTKTENKFYMYILLALTIIQVVFSSVLQGIMTIVFLKEQHKINAVYKK